MTNLSKDKLWDYLYKHRFNSNIEGYRSYQLRVQKQLQTKELIVSFSSGSRFICFPLADLPNVIIQLMKIATKQEICLK